MTTSIIENKFHDAMRAAGLDYDGPIIADGQRHRIKVNGDRKPDSWYQLHPDHPAAGNFGCWKRGINENWCIASSENLTEAERAERDRRWRQQKEERGAEQQRQHQDARIKAQDILDTAQDARDDHPYLVRKAVKSYPGVKQGVWPQRQREGCLLIPGRNSDGRLMTVQAIFPTKPADGRDKDFLKGGAKTGAHFDIGDLSAATTILIAKGYATAATLHEATGYPAVVAFDSGNLKPVTEAIRGAYLKTPLLICADNDRATPGNPGLSKATAIVRQYKTPLVKLATPDFADDEPGSDFNDLAALHGLERVKAVIEAALNPPKSGLGLSFKPAPGSPCRQIIDEADGNATPVDSPVDPAALDYSASSAGTYWRKSAADGESVNVLLANFSAEIVSETVVDDGAERKRRMEITGKLGDCPLPTATIPSGQFAALTWVGEQWGAQARISPGLGLKDRLRFAIQLLSPSIRTQTVYAHTGWREIDGQWLYFSQDAVIGAHGLTPHINVELPGALSDYALTLNHPAAPAIQASLHLLECAAPSIAVPLFLAPYRALISETLPGDFSLFLAGVTGSRKTEVAAILQGHFGNAWNGKHLPGSWSSTPNSLERSAFQAKDALLVVDDFCPGGTSTDVARSHKDADRLLRAQGNRSGRQRMNADGSLRPAYYPRGLIVATGEDIPRGQSLRGRLLILEFTAETVNLDALSDLQRHASSGALASAAGAFCQWLAPRIPELKKVLPERRNQLRNEINATAHSRHPDTLAGLMITAELFAEFAADHGVALPSEWGAGIAEALLQTGKEQHQAIADEEPAARFVRLIESALASGRCHLKPMDGLPLNPHQDFTRYGWQLKTLGIGDSERTDWHECGPCIGRFKHGEDWGIYLDPEAAYALAQRIADAQGQSIPLQQRTLFKALLAKGYLLSRNEPHFTIKTKLPDKSSKRFLHLRVSGEIYGNCGNCGKNTVHIDDSKEENSVPTSVFSESGVGTVGTRNVSSSHSVPTGPARFPLEKTEWEPENHDNKLNINDNLHLVPIVPTVPTFLDRPSPRVSETADCRSAAITPDAAALWQVIKIVRGSETLRRLSDKSGLYGLERTMTAAQELAALGRVTITGDSIAPVQETRP